MPKSALIFPGSNEIVVHWAMPKLKSSRRSDVDCPATRTAAIRTASSIGSVRACPAKWALRCESLRASQSGPKEVLVWTQHRISLAFLEVRPSSQAEQAARESLGSAVTEECTPG
ncbi:hypothetical protein L917_05771 [Phytophthora nicotianae]|uniref:Uncharacterized protein n=2 Tax=Phytophthora nicotianae TaxID=4792 RepID=W2RCD1_PHYN3|nr:hypothetical protein PPTG_20897 [Phytophthora nicotianae INRA-310]ETL96838.1 hypothetical protein L917_05771 [Phytophthora nicotianae]ETN22200.1 hypothetical protein PPTG_20897 [Phytophthora nicotianae INRA-310]